MPAILVLAAAVLLCFGCCVWSMMLVFGIKRRYARLTIGHSDLKDGFTMEELLARHGDQVEAGKCRQDEMERRLGKLEKGSCLFLKGLGMVRFNAFQETGGDLSFSLALLNRSLDGVVITSIYGRDENRIFGKPIREGRSEYELSEEEQAALDRARRTMGEDG